MIAELSYFSLHLLDKSHILASTFTCIVGRGGSNHLVPLLTKLSNYLGSDEACASNDYNFHNLIF